jgi:hypothetical protein
LWSLLLSALPVVLSFVALLETVPAVLQLSG